MNCFEMAFVIVAGSSLAITLLIVFVAAILGKDIPWLESQKERNPDYYRNAKLNLKYCGPIVACMGVLGVPGGVLLIVLTDQHIAGASYLVLSVLISWTFIRLSLWAWRQN